MEKILKVAPSTVSDGGHFVYKSAVDTELFSRLKRNYSNLVTAGFFKINQKSVIAKI